MNHYYMQRARAAHAAAEAADDPRDKAALRGAARTWERLANPSTESAFSMRPLQQQLAALKKDIADAIDAPASAPAVQEAISAAAHGMGRAYDAARTNADQWATQVATLSKPVTIEF